MVGGSDGDALIGNAIDSSVGDALLLQLLDDWSSRDRYSQRVSRLRLQLNGKVVDDAAVDFLYGNSGDDWFVATAGDRVLDRRSSEQVN